MLLPLYSAQRERDTLQSEVHNVQGGGTLVSQQAPRSVCWKDRIAIYSSRRRFSSSFLSSSLLRDPGNVFPPFPGITFVASSFTLASFCSFTERGREGSLGTGSGGFLSWPQVLLTPPSSSRKPHGSRKKAALDQGKATIRGDPKASHTVWWKRARSSSSRSC